jgi:hypothetical protein
LLDAEDTAQLVDALGAINSTERSLASERRLAASEVEPGDAGHQWTVEMNGRWDKTYNTPGLITKFMDVYGMAPLQVLQHLVHEGVVELKWKWKPLEKAIKEHGLDLRTVNHEIEEGDDADVGRVWFEGYRKYVPTEETSDG